MEPEPNPRWKQYLIPTLLSFAVAFSGWSVTQHFIIRSHDTEQEQRLVNVEYRLEQVEKAASNAAMLREELSTLKALNQLELEELKRVRDRLERLEARR